MGLIRYCINLDSLSDYISGLLDDLKPNQFIYETGWQRSKGFRIHSDSSGETHKKIEIPYEEYVITGLRLGVTSMNDIFDEVNHREMDCFHFIVNGEKIFESIYIKDIAMYKNFRVPLKITQEMIDEGLDLQLCYVNNTTSINEDGEIIQEPVDIWFDIDFLAEPKLTEVVINYMDLIPSEVRHFSEGRYRVFSKEISGCYIIGDYFQDIDVVYNNPIIIDFEYVSF